MHVAILSTRKKGNISFPVPLLTEGMEHYERQNVKEEEEEEEEKKNSFVSTGMKCYDKFQNAKDDSLKIAENTHNI